MKKMNTAAALIFVSAALLLSGCGARSVEVTQISPEFSSAVSESPDPPVLPETGGSSAVPGSRDEDVSSETGGSSAVPENRDAVRSSETGGSSAVPENRDAVRSSETGGSTALPESSDAALSSDTGASAPGAADQSDAEGILTVYVCGAVNSPDVYRLPDGSRVIDAVNAAAGFSDSADPEWLNLAERLNDSEMLVVYTREETAQMKEAGMTRGAGSSGTSVSENASAGSAANGAPTGVLSSGAEGTSGQVNLNTATKEQLMTLPGIGEAKADAIIRYREENGAFASIEDIMNISGIKTSVFSKIQDKVTV